MPQLEVEANAAERVWDKVGAPEARRLQTEIKSAVGDLASLDREAMTARMAQFQARGPERSVGRGMSLGL